MNRSSKAAGVAIIIGGVLGGCSSKDVATKVESAQVERTTTTIPPAPKLAPDAPVELLPPSTVVRNPTTPRQRSWEGQRFDLGRIVRINLAGDTWVMIFDREQIVDSGGIRSGPTLNEEPIIVGSSPEISVTNSSTRLRTFGVRANAEILRLPSTWECGQPIPPWESSTVPELAQEGVGRNTRTSITFDEEGQVSRIRLFRGC